MIVYIDGCLPDNSGFSISQAQATSMPFSEDGAQKALPLISKQYPEWLWSTEPNWGADNSLAIKGENRSR